VANTLYAASPLRRGGSGLSTSIVATIPLFDIFSSAAYFSCEVVPSTIGLMAAIPTALSMHQI